MIKPVILSGGKGSRLWPLSREMYPKQYLNLHGEDSLFQQTLRRVTKIDSVLKPIVICNNEHRFIVAEQAQQLGIDITIILEPVGRDTAPAVAVSALICEEDPLLLVLPADHLIGDIDSFNSAISHAKDLALNDKLVTFGIAPTEPHTGYGYIKAGGRVQKGYCIESFVEKPDLETANKYLESGQYLWNSGMFLFKGSSFLNELEKYENDIFESCKKIVETKHTDLDFLRLTEESFKECPAKSIDYAVMERTNNGAVVKLSSSWNDLGSWTSIYDVSKKDSDGNVLKGDVVVDGTTNTYINSTKRLVTAVGVDNLVIVETSDAILVARKDLVQDVKNIVATLGAGKRPEVSVHKKVFRPWGTYENIDVDSRFQVKRLTVKPNQVLSLQKHNHRSEHWVVVKGQARVINGENEFTLYEDQSTYIPVGNIHRLENPSDEDLEIIEVQTGGYLGEDDIIRLEDIYGRKK